MSNNNLEYYFSDGSEKYGPFNLDELRAKNLDQGTLVWNESMSDWKKLEEIPELIELAGKKLPPPLPKQYTPPTISTSSSSSSLVPSRKVLQLYIGWITLHLFALLMASTRISIFNDGGDQRTDKFWPFIDFTSSHFELAYNNPYNDMFDDYDTVTEFDGIFKHYDWTEFLVYAFLPVLLFLIVGLSKTSKTSK